MTDYTPPGQRLHLEFSTAALSANQPTASIVTHHPHVVAAELLVHKQEKFLLDMNPLLTCFYKGKHYTGTYPLCANGAISALAEYDRNAITAFLNNCSAGAYEASLVSSVMDLATCNDLSHIRSEGYCIGVSEAFINPNQNGIHNVQMSSQFCGIPVSRDSRPFTFNLKTNYHQSTVITLTGSDVYSAFESKCAGTKTTNAATARDVCCNPGQCCCERRCTHYGLGWPQGLDAGCRYGVCNTLPDATRLSEKRKRRAHTSDCSGRHLR